MTAIIDEISWFFHRIKLGFLLHVRFAFLNWRLVLQGVCPPSVFWCDLSGQDPYQEAYDRACFNFEEWENDAE